MITAAISGEPKRNESPAIAPGSRQHLAHLRWCVSSKQPDRQEPEGAAQREQGASGPSTTPRPIEARAASITPGSSTGWVKPVASPAAGTWPPRPGRRTIASAVITPAIARSGADHHLGAASYPSSCGMSVYTQTWV
jgi:hypothetical protein